MSVNMNSKAIGDGAIETRILSVATSSSRALQDEDALLVDLRESLNGQSVNPQSVNGKRKRRLPRPKVGVRTQPMSLMSRK